NLKAIDLPIGTYTTQKMLAINEDAVYAEMAQYIIDAQASNCIIDLSDFETQLQGQIDLTGCGMDCEDCKTSLGTESAYVASREDDFEWDYLNYTQQLDLTAQFESEYQALVAECNELCDDSPLTYCDIMRQQMLLDV